MSLENYPAGVTSANFDRLQGIVDGPGSCDGYGCHCAVPDYEADHYCDDVCYDSGELLVEIRKAQWLADSLLTVAPPILDGRPAINLIVSALRRAEERAKSLSLYAMENKDRCDESSRHYEEPMSREDYEEDAR